MRQKRIIGAALIAALFLALIINAQSAGRPGMKMMKELRTELQNFKNNNVFPVLTEWKSKLDAAMSPEDLTKLNELRKKASIMREKMVSEMSAMRKSIKEDENFDKEEFRDKMKEHKQAMHKEMMALGEELRPLAEKYSKTLEEIAEIAKPKVKEWKEQTKAIIDKWKEENQDKIDDMKADGKNNPGMKKMKKGMMRMGSEKRGQDGLAFSFDSPKEIGRFMLWDGANIEMPEPPEPPAINGVEDADQLVSGVRSYPNPFTEKTKIYFTLAQKEKVNLKIIDNSGKIIATIYDGNLSAGEHSFEFNAGSAEYKKLTSGTYIYQLTAGSYIKTGKMVLTR